MIIILIFLPINEKAFLISRKFCASYSFQKKSLTFHGYLYKVKVINILLSNPYEDISIQKDLHMKVTIKDIARECGVSTSAVSLVLNGRDTRISEETQQKIIGTARKYNYRPNRLAVSLLKKETSTFGVIIPDISNIFFAEFCKGCETAARGNGYTLMIMSSDEFPPDSMKHINTFLDSQVDGIIYVAPSNIDNRSIHEICSKIAAADIPFVAVDRALDFPSAKSVLVDNIHGGYIATRHLIELGHERIGCLTGPLCNKISRDRLEGYRMALEEHNLPFDRNLVLEGNFSVDSGRQSLPHMQKQRATALFCFNDMMALGVYRALQDSGLRFPDEMSLVGYDDIFVTSLLETPLTTVNQPAYEIGSTSIRILLALVQGSTDIDSMVFTPVLKIRSSTRPLRH